MKNYRYGWFIGLCMFALVSIFSQTTTAYADTIVNWAPYGDESFVMDITFEDDIDVEMLDREQLGKIERAFSCYTSNFTGASCKVSISSNPNVVDCSESYTAYKSYKGNKNFSYTVVGYGRAVLTFQVGNYKMEKVICVVPTKADLTEVKQEGASSVKLTWNKIEGVTGYIIEQAPVDGEYKELTTVAQNTNTTTVEVEWNVRYRYRVIPYVLNGSEKVCGGDTGDTLLYMTTSPLVIIKSVKPYKDDYLKITWTKSESATGYKLYRSEKKNSGYKCVYTAKSNKTTSWKQKVTKGKKYYYRIVTVFKNKTSEPSASVPQILPKMQLDRTKTNLLVGKKTSLEMKGTSKKVTWSSSNKKIATVNKKGVVTGKKTGTATITAKVGKKKFKCKVSVKKAFLNAEKVVIYKGEKAWLSVLGSKIKSIKSSNKNVVSVKKDGWITAKKAGKTTVTVKGKNGKSYKCKVTVKKPKTIKNTQAVTWQADSIYLEQAGMYIPRLYKFNETGLLKHRDAWWTGLESDKAALSAMNRIYLTCEDYAMALVAKGFSPQSINYFSVTSNTIWYSWSDGNIFMFTLRRNPDTGCYELDITRSLEKDLFFGIDVTKHNREIVKIMLSFISSEPEEVYDAIYECLYEDAYVLSTTEYTKVGDCQVRLDPYYVTTDENGRCYFRFYIRP